MSDTILIMSNGSKWKPSTSSDTVHCVNCENAVDTPAEVAVTQMVIAQIVADRGQAQSDAAPL